MRAVRWAAIFVVAAAMTWLVAATTSPAAGPARSFGGWDAALVSTGLALGIAAINMWRLHERVRRPALHLAAGVFLLVTGFLGILTLRFESPLRTAAPILLMIGNAWTMVALAAQMRVAGQRS